MQLVNTFSVDAPLPTAWNTLSDIPLVVACVPGAELEGQDGDEYHARVAVKVGPVGLTLAGSATVVARDDAAHQMVVRGRATDAKGNGSAEATVTMVVTDNAGRSDVTVTTDLELGGRIAQFGSGVISQVSNRILTQFAKRLNAAIADPQGAAGTTITHTPSPANRHRGSRDVTQLLATALAGVALGLAVGRLVQRAR
ncbi:SRPBCC family protein [Mycolicibacterium mengxianglii]|uniref:SRPBCC family protein n=1 Tax=Mycolicibacterium mengxianglii TaxID=2736649 RepID=UPI0018D0FD95|nr:SRPBCC family protein [Mycolicibacterium mengxianglii]